MSSIDTAEWVARNAHLGQTDKAGRPYIEHPAAVAAITAAAHPDDHNAIAVAWLHDVVEDTTVTLLDIHTLFGPAITEAVDAITRRRGEMPDDYYRRVATNPTALKVKRADIEHNSDPTRLSMLPTETRYRLQRKYQRATARLDQLASV